MSFEFAPVSKGLMVTCAVTSILVGLFDVKHYLHLQLVPHISRHHQYWRLFAHHLAFANSSDLFVAEILLYNVGVAIERQFGSVKYASFALLSTVLSTMIEFLSLLLFHRVGFNYVPAGPMALLFSMLYQYSRIVPSAYQFRIFGVPLSNKSYSYVLAFQLAISRLPGSALVAIIGILSGQLYRSDLANIKTHRLPPSLVAFATRFLAPLFGSIRPPRRSNRALPDPPATANANTNNDPAFTRAQNEEVITTARAAGPPRNTRARNTTASDAAQAGVSVVREWVDVITSGSDRAVAVRVPSETEVAQAQAMFPTLSRDVVVRALQSSANIEGAIEMLLSAQG